MSNIVHLNGRYLPLEQATVNIEDRGFMFSDGVYEVVRCYAGRPIAMAEHLDRLRESLLAIQIQLPADAPGFDQITAELVRVNQRPDCSVYWQVTRGVATRKHPFPKSPVRPTTLAIAYEQPAYDPNLPVPRLKAITRPDVRWHHCAIKAVSLLPNVLDSQAAAVAGCDEAILIRDNIVTEGTSRSIFIHDGQALWTYPLDGRVLDSITRRHVIAQAQAAGHAVRQERYTRDKLDSAREVIAVGTNTEVAAVLSIDGKPVGDGKPGPVTEQLFQLYRQWIARECLIPV
jgi:D-alanine transaminase